MLNEEDKNDAARRNWGLNNIRNELLDELDDIQDDFVDEIEDLIEESYEVKEDLRDELADLAEERENLLEDFGNIRDDLFEIEDDAKAHFKRAREDLEHLKEKIQKHEDTLREKIKRKLQKAKKKVIKRINISVPFEMSEEWKDWAEGLGASVSELVRESMEFVKKNIGDLTKLEQLGKDLDKMGTIIEKIINESGIDDLSDKVEKQFDKSKDGPKVSVVLNKSPDKERIKNRVIGLVKLYNSIPIDKFAQALKKSDNYAENLIYELVANGIEGTLEKGGFKFMSTSEEVISKLNEFINKM